MKRFMSIIIEIKNYLYILKTVKKEMRNPLSDWSKLNLRVNWYGRIYTVRSLRSEDMGEEELVRNWKAMEMMRPINDYLTGLGLQEIVFPSIEQIPETRSYLIVYSPLFKELTFAWILWRIFFLAITPFIYMLIKSLW